MLKKSIISIFILTVVMATTINAHATRQRLLHSGMPYPETKITTPHDKSICHYLGLNKKRTFTLKDIDADLVLVEFINVYCPHCQQQVSVYNRLFKYLNEHPQPIKIIAFAVGNTDKEITEFKQKFQCKYPLLPDTNFTLWHATGATTSPFTLFVRSDTALKQGIIVATHRGMNKHYKKIYAHMLRLLKKSPEELQHFMAETLAAEPPPLQPFCDAAIKEDVYQAFRHLGRVTSFRTIKLHQNSQEELLYTARIHHNRKALRLYAKAVNRHNVCDLCHDVHFIYIFDKNGTIIDIAVQQLTKDKNKNWTSKDINKLKKLLIGRNLKTPQSFDADIDGITSATISSAVVFDSIKQGKQLFNVLNKQKHRQSH